MSEALLPSLHSALNPRRWLRVLHAPPLVGRRVRRVWIRGGCSHKIYGGMCGRSGGGCRGRIAYVEEVA